APGDLRADEGVVIILLGAIHRGLRGLDSGARLIGRRLGVIHVLLSHGARAEQRLEARPVALGVRQSGSGVRELRPGAPVGRVVRTTTSDVMDLVQWKYRPAAWAARPCRAFFRVHRLLGFGASVTITAL